MSDGLKVDFAEIDRMTNALTNLNAYALPLVPKVGAISTDGDLLASAILSPGTAVAAESAVLKASVQLGVTVATTEALVVITASIVKVYETAEAALVVAATAIRITVNAAVDFAGRVVTDVVLGVKSVVYVGVFLVVLAKEAVASGVAGAVAGIAVHSLRDAFVSALQSDGTIADRLNVFATEAGKNFSTNFMAALPALSPKIVAIEQQMLGDLRSLGVYDDLLGTLIADGQRFGLFDDGEAALGNYVGEEVTLPRAVAAAENAGEALFGARNHFELDDDGNIVPTELTSLWASAAQIDSMGEDEFADIRVIKNVAADGSVSFTVQIPSTQSWSPVAGLGPNDLTADMTAMRYGDQTALANAVRAALADQHVGNAPVMLVGFSLGGIAAGSIAANPGDLNVTQVVTAGSPISAMHIPESTKVMTFESTADPIASLDGASNPDDWTNVRGVAPALQGDEGPVTIATAHSAARYAQMAQDLQNGTSQASGSAAATKHVSSFLNGSKTVTDYQARR